MNIFMHLDWDSIFFGKKIASIDFHTNEYSENKLENLIKRAKEESYDLIYVYLKHKDTIPEDFLIKYNAHLADRKVIYSKSLKNQDIKNEVTNIEEYSSEELKEDLIELSYISGEYSRFKTDEKFTSNSFEKLYKEWIRKSITKEMATKVFVATVENKINGMLTVSKKANNGVIGLISVYPKAQGKGYGKSLLQACSNYLINENIFQLDVATQELNIKACAFYKKNGFNIKSITNIYHFWL